MATLVEVYRACSVWQLSGGRYGVRGYAEPGGSERDESFDPTFASVADARRAIDDLLAA